MPENKSSIRQRIYLLTVWRENATTEEDFVFRFSLEDPHTGERFGFTNLDDLVQILQEPFRKGMKKEKNPDVKSK